jgi:hypothetical protein
MIKVAKASVRLAKRCRSLLPFGFPVIAAGVIEWTLL